MKGTVIDMEERRDVPIAYENFRGTIEGKRD
jgi:hypothetical protein